jgi:MFS transporter, NNP family, nitrate/nitrite transporter
MMNTAVLLIAETGWFCVFYAITFGGFVGLVSFPGIFFPDQYARTNVQAGTYVTLCALAGSMIRPPGGYLSDRFGGIRVLTWRLWGQYAVRAGPVLASEQLNGTGTELLPHSWN